MRFGSKSSGYSITYKKDIVANFATGDSQIMQPLWDCQFRAVGIRSHEVEQITRWAINRGMPVEEDGVTAVAPASIARYGVFDTEEFQAEHAGDIFERTPNGFDDAEREKLEAFLLAHQDEYYRALDAPAKPAVPWPTYDTFPALDIAARVQEDGYDVAAVIAYERATLNRTVVIDALEALLIPAEDELLISA